MRVAWDGSGLQRCHTERLVAWPQRNHPDGQLAVRVRESLEISLRIA
jgi:hypothetical protein